MKCYRGLILLGVLAYTTLWVVTCYHLANRPSPCVPCVSYVVKPDDTLWTIAAQLYPDQHTGKMVDAIRRASGLEGPRGPVLRTGQVLWVPDPELYEHQAPQLAAGK